MQKIQTLPVLFTTLLVSPAAAQDDHLERTPTDFTYLTSATAATIDSYRSRGFRLTDVEVLPTRTPTYAAVFVRNAGRHARQWWWYPSLTAREVTSRITATGARITDIEPFFVGGVLRFAVVMSRAQRGDNARGVWAYNKTFAELQTLFQRPNLRLIDLERYEISAREHRYAAAMIENVGGHQTRWSWALNQSPSTLEAFLKRTDLRAYAVERTPNGQINCLATDNPLRGYVAHQIFDIDVRTLAATLAARKMRIVDLEPRPNGRFDVVLSHNGGSAQGFGTGCYGSNRRRPSHSVRPVAPATLPRIGARLSFRVTELPSAAFTYSTLRIGVSKTHWAGVALPLDLGFLGAPGCQMLVAPLVSVPVLTAGNLPEMEMNIPNDLSLIGFEFHSQFSIQDAGANAAGLTVSNGVTTVIGLQ